MFAIEKMHEELKKYCSTQEIFDFYRIIDAETNQIYDYDGETLIPQKNKCYFIWGRDCPCVNCTSERALERNQQIVKLEYMEKNIVLIFSIPIELKGKRYVMECGKDVTTSMTINNATQLEDNNEDITQVIQHFNELLTHDSFTKLYNKNFTYQKILRAFRRAKEDGVLLTVAVMDIDHFKQINDAYGHVTGDAVILRIVDVIRQYIEEESAWASRMGGDEFLVAYEGKSLKEVEEKCRQARATIAGIEFQEEEHTFHVSVSCGAAQYLPGESTNELLDRADKKMYEMKRGK
ncbi:MAG: GGDEF domain-containing protein [Lachnospiraceae bacterium]